MTPFKESLPAIGSQIKFKFHHFTEIHIGIINKEGNHFYFKSNDSKIDAYCIEDDEWEYHFDN